MPFPFCRFHYLTHILSTIQAVVKSLNPFCLTNNDAHIRDMNGLWFFILMSTDQSMHGAYCRLWWQTHIAQDSGSPSSVSDLYCMATVALYIIQLLIKKSFVFHVTLTISGVKQPSCLNWQITATCFHRHKWGVIVFPPDKHCGSDLTFEIDAHVKFH